jgi:hypothetical protein
VLRIVAVPDVLAWNVPSTNAPLVVPDPVMVTVEGMKVGVTLNEVPT